MPQWNGVRVGALLCVAPEAYVDLGDFDLAGVLIIGTIIVPTINFIKRYFPDADSNVWPGVAFLLGLAAAFAKAVLQLGTPAAWDYPVWLGVVVAGLGAALSAAGMYETVVSPEAQDRLGRLKAKVFDGRTL